MSARPCDACGASIEFIEGPNGRPIPVQKIRTVYRIPTGQPVGAPALVKAEIAEVDDPGWLYVSHFETCPDAARFSRRKR